MTKLDNDIEIINCDYFSDRSENSNAKIAIVPVNGNICIYCEHDNTNLTLSLKHAMMLRNDINHEISKLMDELHILESLK